MSQVVSIPTSGLEQQKGAKPFYRDTWVEVDLDAVRANVQVFKQRIPASSSIMAVVKADGYGHGAVRVGQEALDSGASSLAVSMLDEAIVLRKAGITAPILVLGFTPIDSVQYAADQDIALTTSTADWVREALKVCDHLQGRQKPIPVHVKLDTGMGRLGVCAESELLQVVDLIQNSASLKWDGIFTHFACADSEDTTHTVNQHNRFQQFLSALRNSGYKLPNVHCCNTAAAIVFPEWSYDTIRLGSGMYGLYPSDYLRQQHKVSLMPVLSLKTKIAHVKTADRPMTISYVATYTASPGEQIATLPLGYVDGVPRSRSNIGEVLHKGCRVSIVGKVCMDQMMIRIDSGDAEVGDEIVVMGAQGNAVRLRLLNRVTNNKKDKIF